jgi:endonuclease YncB( thermonuclease family)
VSIPVSTHTQEYIEQHLAHIEYRNTQPFYHTFTYCKCVKVYDGDTITVATQFHTTLPPYRFSVRLMGIDAPELKGGGANEHNYAIISRQQLSDKILGKIIRLDIVQTPEKWGRILAYVYLNNENINQWMLDQKLAIPYNGKTKTKLPEWIDT